MATAQIGHKFCEVRWDLDQTLSSKAARAARVPSAAFRFAFVELAGRWRISRQCRATIARAAAKIFRLERGDGYRACDYALAHNRPTRRFIRMLHARNLWPHQTPDERERFLRARNGGPMPAPPSDAKRAAFDEYYADQCAHQPKCSNVWLHWARVMPIEEYG